MKGDAVANERLLELNDVHVYYGLVEALCGVTLRVNRGEIVTLIGANGAGKTTTVNAIYNALPIRRGSIFFDGRRIDGMPPERLARLGIGYVPERRQLFASMTVIDNLMLGAYSRWGKDKKEEIRNDLESVFELFPILKERRGQTAGTLSGGQQQMLAIGRGLMCRPRMLLLDEPSVGLAPIVIEELMGVIRQLKDKGVTVLLVEQNAAAALATADRGYVLQNGRIAKEGLAAALLQDAKVQSAYLGEIE